MNPALFRSVFNFSDLQPEIVESDVQRVIYTARNLQLVEYHFPPSKRFTAHKHDAHEQIGFLVKGQMGVQVGESEFILEAGDYYHAQIGAIHNAWTFDEPAVLLDVFAPPRDDILACSNLWRSELATARRVAGG